jgi:hypothetical protein
MESPISGLQRLGIQRVPRGRTRSRTGHSHGSTPPLLEQGEGSPDVEPARQQTSRVSPLAGGRCEQDGSYLLRVDPAAELQLQVRTRARIVATAAAALRAHGLTGVGVADIMARAGLTHGGSTRTSGPESTCWLKL